MKPVTLRRLVLALTVLLGVISPRAVFVQAQDATYRPTPGFDKVKAAMSRLEREGDKLPKEYRAQLMAKGKECLDLEQRDMDGGFPYARQIKEYDSQGMAIPADLQALIDAENAREEALYAAFIRNVGTAFAAPEPKRVKQMISAIDEAGKLYQGQKCNFYVGKIGELMDVPYFRDVLKDDSPDGRMANEIYVFIEKAVKSKPSGWRQVSALEAELLANNGKFVVGVAQHTEPSATNHGHVCIAAPSDKGQMSHANQQGSGPWVRDSQNPSLSVRASKRFGSKVVEPIWAVWEGVK